MLHYQYKIPYIRHGQPHSEWRVIFSDTGHFYFNPLLRKSYWQLHDIGQAHPELDIHELSQSISYDEVGVLSALIRGLDFGEYFEELSSEPKLFQNDEERDEFLRNLLAEEMLKEENEEDNNYKDNNYKDDNDNKDNDDKKDNNEVKGNEAKDNEAKDNNKALAKDNEALANEASAKDFYLVGYSSDEDSDADLSEPGIVSDMEHALDIDIGDDEAGKEQFLALLDQYKSRISIYDAWEIVEEELAAEFVQNPEYFSVQASQREALFTEWCSNQTEHEQAEISPVLRFLRMLQEHKKDIKKMPFSEFYANHPADINSVGMPRKKKESLYGEMRQMLLGFEKHDRMRKKARADGNQKVLHLQRFLEKHPRGQKMPVEDTGDYFAMWVHLVKGLPESLVNDVNNFIVGDEKRYKVYLEWMNKPSEARVLNSSEAKVYLNHSINHKPERSEGLS